MTHGEQILTLKLCWLIITQLLSCEANAPSTQTSGVARWVHVGSCHVAIYHYTCIRRLSTWNSA